MLKPLVIPLFFVLGPSGPDCPTPLWRAHHSLSYTAGYWTVYCRPAHSNTLQVSISFDGELDKSQVSLVPISDIQVCRGGIVKIWVG